MRGGQVPFSKIILVLVRDLIVSRAKLSVELLALRHQLVVLRRTVQRGKKSFPIGSDIRQSALRLGTSPLAAVNILWLPVQLGNFIVNLTYCSHLLGHHHGWSLYLRRDSQSHWLLGLFMGILWAGSISIYGLGVGHLGERGAIFGFPTYMSISVVTANVAGLLTKEWRGASIRAYKFCLAGMLTLVVAIIVISWPNAVSF